MRNYKLYTEAIEKKINLNICPGMERESLTVANSR